MHPFGDTSGDWKLGKTNHGHKVYYWACHFLKMERPPLTKQALSAISEIKVVKVVR